EHFSTRVYIGARPELRGAAQPAVELAAPLLLGGARLPSAETDPETARQYGTCTLEELLASFGKGRRRILPCFMMGGESLQAARGRLPAEATDAGRRGVRLLLLDDSAAFGPRRGFIDPFLVVAVLHKALKETTTANGLSYRRNVSIVVRSGA